MKPPTHSYITYTKAQVNQNLLGSLSLNIHKSPIGIASSHIPSESQKFVQERKLNPIPHVMNQRSTISTQTLNGN